MIHLSLYYSHILHYDQHRYLDVIYTLNIWISMSLYFQNHDSRCRILWNKLVQIVRPGDRDQETRDMTHTVRGAGQRDTGRWCGVSLLSAWLLQWLSVGPGPSLSRPSRHNPQHQLLVSGAHSSVSLLPHSSSWPPPPRWPTCSPPRAWSRRPSASRCSPASSSTGSATGAARSAS